VVSLAAPQCANRRVVNIYIFVALFVSSFTYSLHLIYRLRAIVSAIDRLNALRARLLRAGESIYLHSHCGHFAH
jgi:hypothetical protein